MIPRHIAGKLALFALSFHVLIITASYTASLAGYLATSNPVPVEVLTFQSIETSPLTSIQGKLCVLQSAEVTSFLYNRLSVMCTRVCCFSSLSSPNHVCDTFLRCLTPGHRALAGTVWSAALGQDSWYGQLRPHVRAGDARSVGGMGLHKRDCQKQHRSLKNMVLREFAGSLYLGVRRTARTASDENFVPLLKVIAL